MISDKSLQFIFRNAGRTGPPYLRQVKSEAELANIRHAIAITEEAMRQVWRACTPGITENELQGLIAYHFAKYDVREFAFHPIIGTGLNGLQPHYTDNNSVTKAGEMMVLDFGARFQGYCADITRTFPVSGKFTPEQREAYSALLNIQKQLIEAVRPGMCIKEINRLSDQLMEEAGYIRYRLHAMCHNLGLETHDFQTDSIFRPGHVITIEPGIYIPADAMELPEGFRGMGIRIEDDVLVTETGHEVLSKRIPKEIDEIEAAMRKR
jgi:Xaa-Pro aminopeptidase